MGPAGTALAIAAAAALTMPASAIAQPVDLPIAPATASQLPPGVKVRQTTQGPVYANARGQVLYGMDMRVLIRWSPDPAQYCQASCAKLWEPLLAPAGAAPNIAFPHGYADARPGDPGARSPARARGEEVIPPGFVSAQKAPDWTIIAGPQGPQWVYKGWHMVFVRKGSAPGAATFDGADNFTWNTLKYVPPVPQIDAPFAVSAVLVAGSYALADAKGRLLFTGACAANCAQWQPLGGGMASRGAGAWTVSRDGDQPQWLYHGRPVFIAQEDEPTRLPAGAQVLRP